MRLQILQLKVANSATKFLYLQKRENSYNNQIEKND